MKKYFVIVLLFVATFNVVAQEFDLERKTFTCITVAMVDTWKNTRGISVDLTDGSSYEGEETLFNFNNGVLTVSDKSDEYATEQYAYYKATEEIMKNSDGSFHGLSNYTRYNAIYQIISMDGWEEYLSFYVDAENNSYINWYQFEDNGIDIWMLKITEVNVQ